MRNPHGYGVWVGEAGTREVDTITCGHCNAVVFVKPGTGSTVYLVYGMDPRLPATEEAGAFCRVCMSAVCLQCHADGRCTPLEKRLEAMESRRSLHRAVGIACLLLLLLAPSAAAQPLTEASRRPWYDSALLIGSLSAFSVSRAMTFACVETQECVELAPVMRKLLGEGTIRAILVTTAVTGVFLFAVERWMPDGKWKTLTLGAFTGFTVWDAAHDVRVMRQIQQRR